MSKNYECANCFVKFNERFLLQRHIDRKTGCLKNQRLASEGITGDYVCVHCNRKFMRNNGLKVHLDGRCPVLKKKQKEDHQLKGDQVAELKQEIQEMHSKINQLIDHKNGLHGSDKPIINNNTLQVLCVGPRDNYLDMLTEEMGFDRALEFVIGCALSDHNGDLRLMEKIYLTTGKSHECPIKILDHKKGKIQFINENHQVIIDPNGHVLSRRLCGNLQTTYLKGIQHLSSKNPGSKKNQKRILEDYDITSGNLHIYKLNESKMQNKIMKLFVDKVYSLQGS